MKYIAILLVALMTGCAGQLEQVKDLNAQNHKVNKIEREISKERSKQVAFAGSIVVAQDGISKSKIEIEKLQEELEKEKAILQELVK